MKLAPHKKRQAPGIWAPGIRAATICFILLLPLGLFSGCSGGDDPAPQTQTEPKTLTVPSSTIRMPSGGVLESEYADSPLGYGLSKIIDANPNTHFAAPHNSFYILWTGSESAVVNYYFLTSAASAPEKDPKSWTLYGSNDNTTWTQLDKRTDQTFTARKEKKEYEFANSQAYKYVKLVIDANNGGDGVQIAEYSLLAIIQDIDDLMTKAGGWSNSSLTPMGKHFENCPATTDAHLAYFADATQEPDASGQVDAEWAMWREFNVQLYPHGSPIPADCNQHRIGDCCAIAVFGSFAYIYPEFIKSIIKDNGNNTYTVAMFDPKGNPIDVTVSNKFISSSSEVLEAVSGKNHVACWSTVLEKAMLKWQYVYKANYNIGGIGTEHVAPLFTGNGNSFSFSPGALSNADLKRAVTFLLKKGHLVIGGFNANGVHIDGYPSPDAKTVAGHAYTFMHAANQSFLFVMRNPWGGHYGIDDSADGMINIPDNTVIPPMIDLRVLEPGKAGNYGTGITTPYYPPLFAPGTAGMRVSPELLRGLGLM